MVPWSGLRRVLLQKQLRSGLCSAASQSDTALYEFRVYNIQPHLNAAFLNLTNQKIHLRTAHSQLIGYWSVEYGAINQVFHIWKYDSYSQRATVRAALAKDSDWLEQYISKAIPMLTAQTNEVAKPLLPWQPPIQAPPTEGGVVELQRMQMRPGGPSVWGKSVNDYIQSQGASGLGKMMGAFYNVIGANNTVQVLWWFQSADHWARIRDKQEQAQNFVEHMDSVSNKLLFPLPFSPLK